MRSPSMPAELRERYGPVVPTWELRARPTPLVVPRESGPDTPEAIRARRATLCRALDGAICIDHVEVR